MAGVTQKVLYEELTPREFQARLAQAPIAYLPLGTLEWHGEHLPLGSDGIQARGFFEQLAARVGGIVLPMLFLGPDTIITNEEGDFYGMDFEGMDGLDPMQLTGSAYWVSDSDFELILRLVLKQLSRAGFRIVTAHGHGPSTESFIRNRSVWLNEFGLETYSCSRKDETDGLGIQTDHAGANETSLVMALRPDLVHVENLSADLTRWPLAVEGEDPRIRASAETGGRVIALNLKRMSKILNRALAQLDSQRQRNI
ncbi:MAG: creatininase family protein [Spirochaetaceae bacterium]|nr:MAG: creatininase family protein [Spirochaetaceae bacterium]